MWLDCLMRRALRPACGRSKLWWMWPLVALHHLPPVVGALVLSVHLPALLRLIAAVGILALLRELKSGCVLIRQLFLEDLTEVFSRIGVMSLIPQSRRMPCGLLENLGVLGRGPLGCSGAAFGVPSSLCFPATFVTCAASPPKLRPQLRSGVSSHCCGARLAVQRCHRTGISRTGILQQVVSDSESHGRLAPCNGSFAPQPLCSPIPVPYGNFGVCPPIPAPRRLDGFYRLTRRLPPSPCPSRFVVLCFCVVSEVFQFKALCFGLSSAPQVVTRVVAPVSSIKHRFGFRIPRYLDDWLVLGSSFQEISRARDFLLRLCDELGILVNLAKSTLTPAQRLDYLGMTLQSNPLRAFPTQARVWKVFALFAKFESSRRQPLALWRFLLGVVSSLSLIVPGSRLRMRSLQLQLQVAGPLGTTAASRIFSGGQMPLNWR